MGHKVTRTTLTALGIAGALTFASSSPAEAALMLSATVGGVDYCATDNNAVCGFGIQLTDLSGVVGVLDLGNGILGGLSVTASLHTQELSSGVGDNNILRSGSTAITNTTGSAITGSFVISATDFVGPAVVSRSTGSGTWVEADGSTIDLFYYNDPGNDQGGEDSSDTPGDLIASFSDTADFDAESFAFNSGLIAVNDPALFSMTLAFDLTLEGGGTLESRGMAELKPQSVPEPFMVSLMGLGLVAAGRRLRRRA